VPTTGGSATCRSVGATASSQHRKYVALPGLSHHAPASVAGGDAGELALEGAGGGPTLQPFHFGRGGDQGSVVRLRRAIDDKGSARERLERRTDNAVGVEIMRPSRASAVPSSIANKTRLKHSHKVDRFEAPARHNDRHWKTRCLIRFCKKLALYFSSNQRA
jgi:hypothetical protein